MEAAVSISLAAAVIFISQSVVASGEPSGPATQMAGEPNAFVTLKDYLAQAETYNPGLKSSFEEWKAAMEQLPQAKALPDPQFTYGYYAQQSDTEKQMVGVAQMFPWFGKIEARTDAATAAAAAARQRYEAARIKLFAEVKNAFYEFAYLGKATAIARDNLKLLKHFEAVARTKYTAAEAGQPDVIRAQVEMARLEDVIRGLEQIRHPIMVEIITCCALPLDANLPWPKVEEFNETPLDYERLVNLLRQKNPELAGLNFEAMAAKSRLELAKKNFYPDIGLGVQWEQMEKDRSGAIGDGGRDSVAIMFQINLPLWRDSYSAGERQARAMATSIEQEKIDTENILRTRVAQSYYEYNDSIRKIRLYRDALIPKGEELLQASETAYKAGTIDFLSLIDSQRLLLDYYLSYERALANNRQKLAELEMLAGAELEAR